MILRFYRVTDKLGIALLKLIGGFYDLLLERALLARRGLFRFAGGILGLVRAVIMLVLGLLLQVGRILIRIASWIYQQIARLLNFALRRGGRVARGASAIGAHASGGAVQSVSQTMARRTARSQMDAPVTEDPLRVQNRVLSGLIVITLVVLISVVIWATSFNRADTSADAPPAQVNLNAADSTQAAGRTGDNEPDSLVLPTAVPTATQVPEVLQAGGTMAYTLRELGQTDIWAVPIGTRNAIRLTNSPQDDRDPAWSPDGTQLAYASRQEDDNWDIYIYDLSADTTNRMTFNLAFESAPDWSPDGEFLVYESYQNSTHLDIFVMRSDGSEAAQRLPGSSESADFAPVWSPGDGRRIAFVSWRDGSKDIFVFDLNTGVTQNVTNTPERDEDHPAWSPDGEYLAYSAVDAGTEKVFTKPTDALDQPAQAFRLGREPAWEPNGNSMAFAVDSATEGFITVAPFVEGGVTTEVIQVPKGTTDPAWTGAALPPDLINSGGLPPGVTEPLYVEQVPEATGDPPYALDTIVNIEGPQRTVLNERVNDSFNALRTAVNEAAGWDFLGELTDAFWDLNRRPEPGQPRRNWFYTGRAVAFNRNQGGFPPDYEVVKETDGLNTYWRVYVRVAEEAQNGQLGEPLREMPWDFAARDRGDVEAYNQGGRLRQEMPDGYYIDLTQIAKDYGWERVPAGSDWRNNFNARNYWLLQKRGGLSWYEAMREIYAESELADFVPTPTPAPTPTAEPETDEET